MHLRRTFLVLGLVAAVLLDRPAAAWAQAPLDERPEDVRPGIVIIVEGIGGVDLIGVMAAPALRKAGLPHQVHRFVWTHGAGRFFTDLQDTQHAIKKAEELAELIRAFRAADPDRPIYVIARSGGTGLTLFALALLPDGCVDRAVLLSAAVAPTYDLRRSLRATRDGIVSFHSRHDQLILNWGTSQFGTMDRYYGPSAGLNGFVVPEGLSPADRALYGRLVQIPWHPRMIRGGHTGSHLGTSLPGFLADEVAPWLR